jgi:hypothetical protein
MPWVKIDEHFPEHPKVAALDELEPLCGWLDLKAKCWANAHLTDGKIPRAQVRRLAATFIDRQRIDTKRVTLDMLTDRLVLVGMWERDGDDFLIHDFLLYQPSREKVMEQRGLKAFAGSIGGKRTAKQRASKTEAESQQSASHAPSKPEAPPVAKSKPVPVPVPVPSASSEAERESAPARVEGWGLSLMLQAVPALPDDIGALLTPEVLEHATANGCRDARKCLEHWHMARWAKRGDRRTWRTDHLADFMAWLCGHGRYGGSCEARGGGAGQTPEAGAMTESIMAAIGGAR